MFAVCVTFEISPAQVEAFLSKMRNQAATSLEVEAGCLRFDVWTDKARPTAVFLYEIYTDAAAFDMHLKSAHFKAFDANVAPMIADKTVATFDHRIET